MKLMLLSPVITSAERGTWTPTPLREHGSKPCLSTDSNISARLQINE